MNQCKSEVVLKHLNSDETVLAGDEVDDLIEDEPDTFFCVLEEGHTGYHHGELDWHDRK